MLQDCSEFSWFPLSTKYFTFRLSWWHLCEYRVYCLSIIWSCWATKQFYSNVYVWLWSRKHWHCILIWYCCWNIHWASQLVILSQCWMYLNVNIWAGHYTLLFTCKHDKGNTDGMCSKGIKYLCILCIAEFYC